MNHFLLQATRDLASSSPRRRQDAARQLALLGRDEILQAIGPLLATLDDPDPELRLLAAWALLEASPLPAKWIPDLMLLLHHERPEVRVWCCALLGECQSDEPDPRGALRRSASSDPEAEVRATASAALRGFHIQAC